MISLAEDTYTSGITYFQSAFVDYIITFNFCFCIDVID